MEKEASAMAKGSFTRLEDMSEVERRSWATLLVDVSAFLWFWKKMTGGFAFTAAPKLAHTQASDIVDIFIGVIIVTVVLHAVIASVFAMRAGEDKGEKDERDIDIERRGAAAGFWVLTIVIHIIAVTLLIEYSAGSGEGAIVEGYDPPYSVISPPHMFFALTVLAFVGDIVKNSVMLLAYRGE